MNRVGFFGVFKWTYKKFLERSLDVLSSSGEERQELNRLRREKERLVHQIDEQAVDIEFLKKLKRVEPF